MELRDRLTKYSHFIPVSHPYTGKEIDELFTKEVVKLQGFSSSIVSDRRFFGVPFGLNCSRKQGPN